MRLSLMVAMRLWVGGHLALAGEAGPRCSSLRYYSASASEVEATAALLAVAADGDARGACGVDGVTT